MCLHCQSKEVLNCSTSLNHSAAEIIWVKIIQRKYANVDFACFEQFSDLVHRYMERFTATKLEQDLQLQACQNVET